MLNNIAKIATLTGRSHKAVRHCLQHWCKRYREPIAERFAYQFHPAHGIIGDFDLGRIHRRQRQAQIFDLFARGADGITPLRDQKRHFLTLDTHLKQELRRF